MKLKTSVLILAAAAVLSACGGGGGSPGTSPFGSKSSSGATATSAAASLALSLSASSVLDTDTGGVTVTLTATDSSGKTVSGVNVSYKVTGGNYTQDSSTTDSKGENTITVKLGSNKANRTITIVGTDGTNTATAYLTVTGAKISSTANPSVVAPNGSGSVIFRLLDASSNALASQAIEIQTTAGATATGTTDANGQYTYNFQAPASTGTLTVTATAGGVTTTQDVQIQSSGNSIPDSSTPTQATLEVNPSVVSVNTTGSTANSSTIRALFKGSANNALANVRVKFDLAGDPNSVGGSLSASEVYTDADGYAITSYVPGTRSSPTDGVTVRACWGTTGAPSAVVCSSGNTLTKTLTVTSEAVSVTVGTDENVYTDVDLLYYRRFVVQVVDGAGNPRAGVTISPSIDLLRYAKGSFSKTTAWTLDGLYECVNEDLNRNSVLAPSEDVNHDQVMEPRKADVSVSFENSALGGKTDANGRIVLRVIYPRTHANWVKMALNVSGSVNGSEGRASWIEWLPYPATGLTGAGAPAFVVSPYGSIYADVTLSASRTLPDGTVKSSGAVLTPCENPAPPNELTQ